MRKPIHLALLIAAPALLAGCDAPAAGAKGGLDPETGIPRDALIGVMGIGDGNGTLYGVLYEAKRVDQAQLQAAPAKLCAAKGAKLISARNKDLEHPDTMPGARKLMVRCK